MNVQTIVLYALVASIIAGGVIAAGLELVVRARRLRPTFVYRLWLVALLAVVAVPFVAGTVSIARTRVVSTLVTRAERPVLARNADQRLMPAATLPPAPTIDLRTFIADHFQAIALGLWGLGAAIGLGWIALSLRSLAELKRRSSPLEDAFSRELPWLSAVRHGERETYLRLSYEIEAPLAIGFLQPVILIPTDLANENGLKGLEDLVIHEHAHLVRFDDYTNLAQRIIECLFWINPFVLYIGRKLTLAREMAADEAVVERGKDRAHYADSLWR